MFAQLRITYVYLMKSVFSLVDMLCDVYLN